MQVEEPKFEKKRGNMMVLLQDGALPKHHSQSEQWSVPSANRRGVTFGRLEVGRAVRDPVARCSCWLLHRIYTAYWATDRRHRLVVQVTGWAWSRMDGRSHDGRHSCIHLMGKRDKKKEQKKRISLFDKEQQRINQFAQWHSRKPTRKTQDNRKSEQANYKQ